ncbi:hypothetical protein [Desulfovibrio sp. TomC]|uniref:hypothetical protein n=1 Tax=Desulfovibrio sp. TomC TaxID=1562888 RepID=UPI0005BE2CAD|nr:hypothetical protein [Desulfovibrio sp. TomC]
MLKYPHVPCSRILVIWSVLTLCLLAGLVQPAKAATWSLLTPSPTGNTLYDAYSPDDGATMYIVGDGGLILKKIGATYSQMESGTLAPLKGIHGRGPNDIWAVGGSQATGANTDPIRSVLLHFDGTGWSATTPPTYSSYPDLYPVNDVWVSSTGQAYAVTSVSGAPVKWNAGLAKWEFENVTIPAGKHSDYTLSAIYGFADDDVYAVGSYGTILHRDNNGWTIVAQYESSGWMTTNLLQTVWGPSAAAVFAGGNYGQLYRLQPSVSSDWAQVNQGDGSWMTPVNMLAMHGTGPNDIWFVGAGGAIQHWTGSIDNLTKFTDEAGKTRNTLWPNGDGQYFFGGSLGLMERFDPTGGTRQTLNTPPAVNTPWKTAVFSGYLWLAPQYTDAATGIYAWDGGRMTKHPIAGLPDNSSIKTFKAFSPTDMWFSSIDYGTFNATIKRGNGTAWTDWTIPGTGGYSAILDVAKTASRGYVVLVNSNAAGQPCVVGSEFPTCLQGGSEVYQYAALAASPNGDVHAVGKGGQVALWRNGAWSVSIVGPNGDDLTAVAAANGMVVAVGVNGSAFYSTDGTTWQPVAGIPRQVASDPSVPLEFFTAVTYAGDGVFWAALNTSSSYTDGGKGFLYRIQNGTGALVQGGFSSPLSGLGASQSQSAAFAVGDNGVIWTTNPNFKESAATTTNPSMYLLLDN